MVVDSFLWHKIQRLCKDNRRRYLNLQRSPQETKPGLSRPNPVVTRQNSLKGHQLKSYWSTHGRAPSEFGRVSNDSFSTTTHWKMVHFQVCMQALPVCLAQVSRSMGEARYLPANVWPVTSARILNKFHTCREPGHDNG